MSTHLPASQLSVGASSVCGWLSQITPSIAAHILSAICLAIGVAILTVHYRAFLKLNPLWIGMAMVVLAFGIGQHAQSHAQLEAQYGFHPIRWFCGSQ